MKDDKKHYGDYGLDCTRALGGKLCSASDLVFAYQGEAKPYFQTTKIKVDHPVVFMDGDEDAKSVFKMVKNNLIYPFLDLDV